MPSSRREPAHRLPPLTGAVHEMAFALDCRYRTDGMGAADSFGIDLAEAEVQNLSFLINSPTALATDFDRRTGVDAV